MMRFPVFSAILLAAVSRLASADPALECGKDASSQVEIGRCVHQVEQQVEYALDAALRLARDSARQLDAVTGRDVAVPAFEASQSAWASYRDRQCDLVGAMFGGGSGTGIGITACRIDLGRARVEELMTVGQ